MSDFSITPRDSTQIEASVEVTEQIHKMWRDIIPEQISSRILGCSWFFFFTRLLALCFAELLNTVTLNQCLKLFCTKGMEGDKCDVSFKEISEEPRSCRPMSLMP